MMKAYLPPAWFTRQQCLAGCLLALPLIGLHGSVLAQSSLSQRSNASDAKVAPLTPATGTTTQVVAPGPGPVGPFPVYDDIQLLASPGIDQSRPHISADPTDSRNLIVAANTYTSASGTRQAGYYYSNDGGRTWQGQNTLPNAIATRGNPVTAYDATGKAYLSGIMPDQFNAGIHTQSSVNKGVTWTNKTDNIAWWGFTYDPAIAVDDVSGSPYVNRYYAVWYDNTDGVDFTVSTDGATIHSGQTSPPIALRPQFSGDHAEGPAIQTGPFGQIYVCWGEYPGAHTPATGFGFTKSTNGGASFTPYTTPVAYAGIRNLYTDINPLFNNTAVNDYPSMAVDKSCVHSGRIYVTYPAKENGNGKAVVQVVYSDNEGLTWSSPVTVSPSASQQSWMPSITVDPGTGEVSVAYFSMDSSSGYSTNTYLAHSVNGSTYTNIVVSDFPHITQPISVGGYAGDRISVTSRDNTVYPVWMDNRNGSANWQLYTSPVRYFKALGPATICASKPTRQFLINQAPGYSNVIWTTSPAGVFSPAASDPNVSSYSFNTTYIGSTNATATVTATAVMLCGSTITSSFQVSFNTACREAPATPTTAYPNPANEQVALSSPELDANMLHTGQLYDRYGKLQRTLEWRGDYHALDTSTLPDGMYYLVVQRGTETDRSTLVVQH